MVGHKSIVKLILHIDAFFNYYFILILVIKLSNAPLGLNSKSELQEENSNTWNLFRFRDLNIRNKDERTKKMDKQHP